MTRRAHTEPTTPRLDALELRHGKLGDRLLQIRVPQREEIAEAAYEEGVLNAMNKLEVSVEAMGDCMRQAGYDQCGGCEEWFPHLELEELEGAEFLEIGENPKRCEECKMADDGDWAAPPPPEPTTPEEIAAAEEKKQKARDAVIRQEERAAQRKAILDSIPDPEPSQHGVSGGNPQGTRN
jgi:hypothetical protein